MRSSKIAGLRGPLGFDIPPMAAGEGGRLVVHFTNRKNAPFDFPHDRGSYPNECRTSVLNT